MLQNTNPFEPLSKQSSHGKPGTNITDKFTFDTDNIAAMNKADTKSWWVGWRALCAPTDWLQWRASSQEVEEGSLWPERCSSWQLAFTLSAIQIASFLGRKVKNNSDFLVVINIRMDHIKYRKY